LSEQFAARRAQAADAGRIADVLGSAFMTDPVSGWLFPDPADRARLHPAFFRVFVDLVLRDGLLLTDPDVSAVTLWLDVGAGHPDDPAGERETRASFDAAIGGYASRFAILDALLSAGHPTGPHAYLPFVAVLPERQGHGTGAALLSARLVELDAAHRPAYLEASSPRNAALYARLGFRRLGPTIDLPDGPSLYPMWRPAAA
jgi:GNAT superfamily N-acetyltransferase